MVIADECVLSVAGAVAEIGGSFVELDSAGRILMSGTDTAVGELGLAEVNGMVDVVGTICAARGPAFEAFVMGVMLIPRRRTGADNSLDDAVDEYDDF